MLNIESVFIFLLIFNFLYVVNLVFRLIRALIKPERFILSKLELLFLGLSLSYISTYLIQLK
jgi:hypothetical protein